MAKKTPAQIAGVVIVAGLGAINTVVPIPPAQIPLNKPTTQLSSVVKEQDKQRKQQSQPTRKTEDKAQKK